MLQDLKRLEQGLHQIMQLYPKKLSEIKQQRDSDRERMKENCDAEWYELLGQMSFRSDWLQQKIQDIVTTDPKNLAESYKRFYELVSGYKENMLRKITRYADKEELRIGFGADSSDDVMHIALNVASDAADVDPQAYLLQQIEKERRRQALENLRDYICELLDEISGQSEHW